MLERNAGRLNYTKLIKILYIADREHYRKWGKTITGDSYYSMENGPVLSGLYSLIKGNYFDIHMQMSWDLFFEKKGYDVIFIRKKGRGYWFLSPSEMTLLDEMDRKFKHFSYSDLIRYTHDKERFPEVKWDKANGSSLPISEEDFLIRIKGKRKRKKTVPPDSISQ